MPAEPTGRLSTLPRNDRADLLLLALPNAALREACRQLQLTFPGYRLEAVKPVPTRPAYRSCSSPGCS